MSSAVEILLTLTAILILIGMAGGLFLAARYEARARRRPLHDAQHDLANMMILFQTMRDIVQQQKELARQFNDTLEQRIGVIRGAASAAAENLDRLQEAERRLFLRLEEVAAELSAVQKQTHLLREERHLMGPMPQENASRSAIPSNEECSSLVNDTPNLQVVAPPTTSSEDDDLFSHWVGFDFGVQELDPYVMEMPPDEAPDAPEDPQAAREAFRTLLNFDEPGALPTSDDAHSHPAGQNNGRGAPSPLQARIFEYHDAGMTVSEIAQELGIGKGEIRLILTLRKNKEQ